MHDVRASIIHKLKPWAYMLLPLALLAVFFFLPLLWAFVMSCFDYSDLTAPEFIGFNNYIQLVQSPAFYQSLFNTIILMLWVVPVMVILPIPMALLTNQPVKGQGFFRAAIYFPVVLSPVVAAIIWKWLYAEKGLLNYFVSFLGVAPIHWLVLPGWVLLAIANMVVWKGVAYYMMMYLASLQSVNQELYDAVKVDGASFLQRHWTVTLPHLRSTMSLVAIVTCIGLLKLFGEIYVLTQGGPVRSSTTLVYAIYEQSFGHLNLGFASAMGFVLMLFILLLSAIQFYTVYLKAEKQAMHS